MECLAHLFDNERDFLHVGGADEGDGGSPIEATQLHESAFHVALAGEDVAWPEAVPKPLHQRGRHFAGTIIQSPFDGTYSLLLVARTARSMGRTTVQAGSSVGKQAAPVALAFSRALSVTEYRSGPMMAAGFNACLAARRSKIREQR